MQSVIVQMLCLFFLSLLPTNTPLFPSHSQTAGLICALLRSHTNTHCIRPPSAAESTLLYLILSPSLDPSLHPSLLSPAGLSLLPYSACTHHLSSVVVLLPVPLGPSIHCHCCNLDLSRCWIVEKTKFVRDENHYSGLPVSEEMTCLHTVLFPSLRTFSARNTVLCLNSILHTVLY